MLLGNDHKPFPFSFCPACGKRGIAFDGIHRFTCADCGFEFFHNVAAAVGIIICVNDEILCLERSKDPGKGRFGFPGGFVDPGESAAQALARECREEIGTTVPTSYFLGGYANDYPYKSVPYNTCDLIFASCLSNGEAEGFISSINADPDEVASIRWFDIASFDESLLAFDSLRHAFRDFRKSRAN